MYREIPRITLAAARVNAGLSQKAAAAALNISNHTLSSYEAYRTFPSLETLCAMIELYKYPVDLLRLLPEQAPTLSAAAYSPEDIIMAELHGNATPSSAAADVLFTPREPEDEGSGTHDQKSK